MNNKLFSKLQQFGQALLVPVALLPAGGLLYGLGMAMASSNLTSVMPFLLTGIWPLIAKMMSTLGSIIFGNLPLLFAVGVAVGLAENHDGTAGLSAVAGYLVLNQVINSVLGIDAEKLAASSSMYQTVLGTATLRTGVFGGIIIGLIAAWAYNRFHTLKLPEYIGFFQAKRSVPIITVFLSILVGFVLCIIWPSVQKGLDSFSYWMLEGNPKLGLFIYGFIVKILNPVGLHTAFNTPFMYQFGSYVNKAGEVIMGDKAIFYAQLADNVKLTGGVFQNAAFAMDMLACWGGALAIIRSAKPENRKYVTGLMVSACITSFLTGITEPWLFSFLFVAPLCFVGYALINASCYVVCYLLDIHLVASFAAGFIDFLLVGVLNNVPRVWLLVPVGIVYAAIEYFVFTFLINRFNYKTPGREEEEDYVDNIRTEATDTDRNEQAKNIIEALGGKENIETVTNCATRLRATVFDESKVRENEFKKYGGKGVFHSGKNYQIVIGLDVINLIEEIKREMEDE